MIRKILTYNESEDILSQKSQIVENFNICSDEIQSIIQDMKDTLHNTRDGKGLSAIQIGHPLQICICSWDGQEIVMINPEITKARGQQEYLEGCLSEPNVYVKIPRAQKVWCTYCDEEGTMKVIAQGGRMSNIIQHELDHFEGICRVHDFRK